MGGFRLVFGPLIHQEGLDEVIAYYGVYFAVMVRHKNRQYAL